MRRGIIRKTKKPNMTDTKIQLETFFSQFPSKKFNKKQVIIHDYQSADTIYYLNQGYVRMYAISKSGQELNIHIFKPGSYFPMMFVMAKTSNKYFFKSLTNVEVN